MIGILFDVFPTKEQREIVTIAARKCAFAENALWSEMRRADPVSPEQILAGRKTKETTGKFPKLPKFVFERPDGKKASAYCGTLAEGLSSRVYDAVAYHVGQHYFAQRWELLTFQRSLPVATKPRLRLRKGGLLFGRDEKKWLTARIIAHTGEWMTLSIRLRGRNPHTIAWIDELIRTGDAPSASVIKLVHKGGKWKWQLSTSRPRGTGEVAQVEPIDGRVMRVFAPVDQSDFLRCECQPDSTDYVRRESIPGDDLENWAFVYAKRRRAMQKHWRQSPTSAAHGRGRKRAILGPTKLAIRYENAVTNWIEQKSHYIAELAREWQCDKVTVERLQDRDSSLLRAGSFPYFKLISRIGNKTMERNMKFATFAALTKFVDGLSAQPRGEKRRCSLVEGAH